MTRRRWIADELQGTRAALTGAHAAHLARVLRARVGQEFDIATGSEVRVGRVISVHQDRVEFDLGDLVEARAIRPITVALAVFKFDRFEWAIEKCTELGAARIVPILARRTETHLAAAAPKRVDRWRRICHEASQQSRRAAPPEITDPIKLKQYLASESGSLRIVLAETEQQILLRDVVRGEQQIVLAVGPEGGWSEDELKLFEDAGWQTASLGDTILRAETAAIAGLAIVAALAGT
jgi:16S rRNA (uracil1498-N3)-methyltransferase